MNWTQKWRSLLPCASLCGIVAAPLNASELDPLLSLSLEELMNVEVSLTSRVEESQFSAPAAVYVLT